MSRENREWKEENNPTPKKSKKSQKFGNWYQIKNLVQYTNRGIF